MMILSRSFTSISVIIPLLYSLVTSAVIPNNKQQSLRCDPWTDTTCEYTDRPIIGILSQLIDPYTSFEGATYIAASYVKWAESGGARVVPVMVHENRTYYKEIMQQLNGMLIPGGDQNMTAGPFMNAVQYIYNETIALNREGVYFPLWGTCLGFEFLTISYANGGNWLSHCEAANQSLALEFTNNVDQSRLFNANTISREVFTDLASKNITNNEHHYCLTTADFTKSKMNRQYRLLSTSNDYLGGRFVSAFEHREYPIYGVIFHPEKANFEPSWHYSFNHGADAVRASQYFAWFFVNEARKNPNHFPSQAAEYDVLIYNYNATFTAKTGGYFEQEYQFPN